jgi:RecA-family ATPase
VGNDDDGVGAIRSYADIAPRNGPREFLVAGMVPAGLATNLYGDGGTMKSYTALHLQGCVARGESWLGRETIQTSTLNMDFELEPDEHASRMQRIADAHFDSERPHNAYHMHCAGMNVRAAFMRALGFCIENGVGLVVVDSLGVALQGDAEAARDVIGFFGEIEGTFRRHGKRCS